ncbi:Mov34/MPN/PAD-1 family protein [Pantoea agglomerans]|uniref:Mov34/MPN/PAD-1 family protein n=1 Tax=Enterobacter agglomerans TaxID=549 RepID=UPI00320A8141
MEAPWSWTWPDIEGVLLVSHSVADTFRCNRQISEKHERGGQLFVDLTHPDGIILSLATAPHKADKAGRTWLELDPERCKKEIQEANALGLRLIGYWHTHPQVIPQISGADISSFSRFAQRYSQVLPHPVAIIVGTSPDTSGIKAWSFREGMYIEAVRMDFPI